jgi:hypothetical protein
MAESTVAAVQAALNKKQVDLYELQVSFRFFTVYNIEIGNAVLAVFAIIFFSKIVAWGFLCFF